MKIRIKTALCTQCGRYPLVEFDGTLRCDCGHKMKASQFASKSVRRAVEQAKQAAA